MNKVSNFNKLPSIRITGWEQECRADWENICETLSGKLNKIDKPKKFIVIECYQGVDHEEILKNLKRLPKIDHFIETRIFFFLKER